MAAKVETPREITWKALNRVSTANDMIKHCILSTGFVRADIRLAHNKVHALTRCKISLGGRQKGMTYKGNIVFVTRELELRHQPL